MVQKDLLTKLNVTSIGENIGHELATNFVSAYTEANPNDVGSYMVGRDIIDQILAQPGCVGLRFYNALNEKGEKTLVYVGVDAEGKSILEKVVVNAFGTIVSEEATIADRIQTLPSWWPF